MIERIGDARTDEDRCSLSPGVIGRALLGVLGMLSLSDVGLVCADVLSRTDFESGLTGGWVAFTTPNGTLGGEGFPALVKAEERGGDGLSRCWQVKVGQLEFLPERDSHQGGGLEISQETPAGWLHLSAFIMARYQSPRDRRNLAAGRFQWLVNDRVVSEQDLGPIENGAVLLSRLLADIPVAAGLHVIQLRISRPFKSAADQVAPLQCVDDLLVEWSP